MWLNVISAKLNSSELACGCHLLQHVTSGVALWGVAGPLWGFVASVVYCIVALLADHMTDQLFLFGKSLWILAPSPPSLPGGWWFLK